MNARLVLAQALAMWLATPALAEVPLPDPPHWNAGKKEFADWVVARDKLWPEELKRAGKAVSGMVLDSYALTGKKDLLVSVRNVSEVVSTYGEPSKYGGQPDVFVRDKDKHPVQLTDFGARNVWRRPVGGSFGGAGLGPGEACGYLYSVCSNYAVGGAGRVEVLSTFSLGKDRTLVARPITIPRNANAHGAGGPRARESSKVRRDGGGDGDWPRLLGVAGKADGGCMLYATISPSSPKSVHLVVSIVYIAPVESSDGNLSFDAGGSPADYSLLVRDRRGNRVPLTNFGHKVLDARKVKVPRTIRLGGGIGTWFPLDEMFPLKSGEEYTVVAAIGGFDADDQERELVSAPLKFRTPEMEVAGVNRPGYGSPIIWDRLASLGSEAVSPDGSRYTLEPTDFPIRGVNRTDLPIGGVDFVLRSRAAAGRHVGDEYMETTDLVRDADGKPVAPMENERALRKPRELYDTSLPTSSGNAWAGEGGGLGIELGHLNGYPVVVGQHYTVLTAFDFKDGKSSTIVGPQVTVTVQPRGMAATAMAQKHPQRAAEPLTAGRWGALAPFAGKAFEGLVLKVLEAKGGRLKLALASSADRPLVVKKWESGSGFAVLVRDQSGAEVRLSEAGRKYFQAGKSLQIALLKPHETIEQSIPVAELFDTKTPGEYTVLASLPVVGDVDAVLTAAPVKIRIDRKPVAPRK